MCDLFLGLFVRISLLRSVYIGLTKDRVFEGVYIHNQSVWYDINEGFHVFMNSYYWH